MRTKVYTQNVTLLLLVVMCSLINVSRLWESLLNISLIQLPVIKISVCITAVKHQAAVDDTLQQILHFLCAIPQRETNGPSSG
jgi:transcriptional regulatory protein LevR